MAKIIALPGRGVLKIGGDDASEFLQNLITNNMSLLDECEAIFAGLLSPQGKLIAEFFVVPFEGGYLLELLKSEIPALLKKLTLYKLRADVELEDLSDHYKVFVLDDSSHQIDNRSVVSFNDPRSDQMGERLIAPDGAVDELIVPFDEGGETDYISMRLDAAIPEGGDDYQFGETFPHEAVFDQLNAIDFNKGCYIGQEVVSRMQHRGTARKRIMKIVGEDVLSASGDEIRTETSLIGAVGTRLGREGLALVRLDRAETAKKNGEQLKLDDIAISLHMPSWADYKLSS